MKSNYLPQKIQFISNNLTEFADIWGLMQSIPDAIQSDEKILFLKWRQTV